MRKYYILTGLYVLLGFAASIVYRIWPESDSIKFNPWLDKSYVFFKDPEGIPVKWFIKAMSTEIQEVILFFVVAKVAQRLSLKLFATFFVLFFYNLFDAVMLWVNYKTSDLSYYVFIIVGFISVISLFFPERKTAVIKSME